ncbi:sigma-70 family RNA polymerase sigma factor [Solwaraspora sp. WMMA2065]|uniref:RNA polymerase sigma factor n=1 Tax=Solwaraspora sp. WMMA2065 TaxID=3015166 RepID=UPI00259B7948|nr:sigma-70 family RNA polymerase sigma factor [Solwaraspora sp. WMMA2065]WJK34936.1 sigma-70 family RNA polymerase sigma factor [Solwaraspora sp. WMMA2065]
MDDRAIVAALVAGDPRGLDRAYRMYADRLYTYCRFVLRDADGAADAVHDTFVLAGQRAAQLRDPERLRPWLYAIARNECLRVIRGRRRQLPLDEVGELPATPVDPVTGLGAEQLRELVRSAAAGLNPGDRQVIELAIRHDLSAADVGAVLGVSDSHAHARLSRARAQLERAIGALLVARTGADDCPTLGELLHGWDGTLTVLLRKRVSRHIESCPTCADRRRRQVSPAALFSAYATLPMLAVPAELWPRLKLTSADAGQAATRARIEQRAGRFDPATGFPRRGGPRRNRLLAGLAAAAVLALLIGGAVVVPRLGAVDDTARSVPAGSPGLAAPPPVPSASSAPPTTPGEPAPTTPTPTAPAGGAPEPSGPAEPAPPLTVQAEARVSCTGFSRYQLTVVATVTGGTVESAVLTWTSGAAGPTQPPTTAPTQGPGTDPDPTSGPGAGGPGGIAAPGTVPARGGEVAMTVSGDTATGQVWRMAVASVSWQVAVVAVDGRRAGAGPYPAANPCPVPG